MKNYLAINVVPQISVKAKSPKQAAKLVVERLNELDDGSLGGDPLTDLYDSERDGYVIKFEDGSSGVA